MFPNLLGQKAYHHMSNEDMANIIGISRTAYEKKMKTGKFNVAECNAFIRYFNKPYDYLFHTETYRPA